MRTIAVPAILCVIVLLMLPARAEAYLDPSTGSIVLQVLIGGLLAAAATARVFWHRLVSVFRKEDRQPPAGSTD